MATDGSKTAYQKAQERNRKAGGAEDVTTLRSFISGNERALLNWLRKSVALNNQIDEGRARRILDELNEHEGNYDFLSDDDWEFIYDTAKQTRENPEYNEAFRNEHNEDFSDGSIDPDARSLLEEDEEALADDYEKYLDDYYSEDNIKARKEDEDYNKFLNTLPDNQRLTPEKDYSTRRYWELNGKPKDFEEAKQKGMYTLDKSDGLYHANSLAWGDDGVGYFMKPKHHDTLKYETDWYNYGIVTEEGGKQHPVEGKEKEEWEEFRNNYDLDTSGDFYRYVPKQKVQEPVQQQEPAKVVEGVEQQPEVVQQPQEQPKAEAPVQQTVTAEAPVEQQPQPAVVEQPKAEATEQPAPQAVEQPVQAPAAPVVQQPVQQVQQAVQQVQQPVQQAQPAPAPAMPVTAQTTQRQTPQQQASAAGQRRAEAIVSNAATTDAYRRQVEAQRANFLNNVARAQALADQEAINAASASMQSTYKSGLDRILAMGEEVRKAEREAAADQLANQRAARWTGATEALASLANLVAVGSGNAVSQQYHDYSQDWMRRADMNAREHRARIANLRERQRSMQDRLLALQAGNADTLAELRMKANESRAKRQTEIGKAVFDSMQKSAESASKATEQASRAQYDADLAGIRIASGGRRASSGGGSSRTSTTKTGSSTTPKPTDPRKASGESYHVSSGGKDYVAKMSKSTRKQAMTEGIEELKEDILNITGASSWEELEAGTTGKKGKYKGYYDIVQAINDGDTDAIDYWYSTHRKQCGNMGEFLLGVANGYWEEGAEAEAEEEVKEEPAEEKAEDYGGSDGENFDFHDEPAPDLKKPKKKEKKNNSTQTSGSWADKYK